MQHIILPEIFYKILIIVEALFFTGGIAIFIICFKKSKETRQKQWLKFWTYVIIVHFVIITAWMKSIFVLLCSLIAITGFIEILKISMRTKGKIKSIIIFVAIYTIIALCFIGFSLSASPQRILFVYLVVAIFDAFSQITGQLFGHHKLAPDISPAKTIEGAVGGFSSAVVLALGFNIFLTPVFDIPVLSGCIIAVSSLIGDLSSSWFKRLNKVKDFSTWLPGQGGVLDRFNSFILSAAVIFLFSSL